MHIVQVKHSIWSPVAELSDSDVSLKKISGEVSDIAVIAHHSCFSVPAKLFTPPPAADVKICWLLMVLHSLCKKQPHI